MHQRADSVAAFTNKNIIYHMVYIIAWDYVRAEDFCEKHSFMIYLGNGTSVAATAKPNFFKNIRF